MKNVGEKVEEAWRNLGLHTLRYVIIQMPL